MRTALGLNRRLTGWVLALWPCLASAQFAVGDCAVYREGGEGRLLKAPVYWLKGTVAALSVERRQTDLCPRFTKSAMALTREEKWTMARAFPCADRESDIRFVDVRRVRLVADAWETPWSSQHGTEGLWRGSQAHQGFV